MRSGKQIPKYLHVKTEMARDRFVAFLALGRMWQLVTLLILSDLTESPFLSLPGQKKKRIRAAETSTNKYLLVD